MTIRTIYDSESDVPEQYRDLYEERDGRWELTGIEGVKTQQDVDRVREALRKEKEDHTETKDKLRVWTGLGDSPTAVQEALDRIPVLEASQGQIDEAKLEEVVRTKVAAEVVGRDREIERLTGENTALGTKVSEYETRETQRTIGDALREAAIAGGDKRRFPVVRPSAVDDVVLIGMGQFEVLDGGEVVHKETRLTPTDWLADQQTIRSHWWPESEGGGARGGSGSAPNGMNPWSADNWNMTEQGRYVREHGVEKADRMARAAGTTLGALPPPRK